eukprot:TRINITY_DN4963_c0_g2_i4.p2 TRINITY_DN4963_c0_g2~~TRINITY_DN4963_c0_g2_i4.p2  ORF type:complete len:211 (+),score=48.16 TRINITY_DN4963_c0_g2_i4:1565-2197(+)
MGIVSISKHRKLLAYCMFALTVARKFHVYEYENPFSPEYSSDSAITTLEFSNVKLEIFVGGCNFASCAIDRFIKVWNAKTGRPERLFTGDFNNEITALCFDKKQRRIFAGDGDGAIKVFDSVTGVCIHKLESLSSEVTFLFFNSIDKTLLAIYRNSEIRIYKDFKKIEPGERELLRLIRSAHTKEITVADYHLALNLFAFGSNDGYIKVW